MVRIPVEYQEVEYLESDGSQCLNLPYGFLDTDEVELVCEVRSTISDRFMISTSTWNNNHNRFCMAGNYSGNFRVGFGDLSTSHGYLDPVISLDALKHTWRYKNRLFEMLDGNTQIASCDVSSVNFGGETSYLKLFYGYNKNTAGRIYSFKQIKQLGESLNLIPCYRKSDSEPGMYDTVSGTFFTNAGTGTFIVGNDVSWDTASLIERRRQILLNTPHLTTLSANPLTFQTNISANLKDCKIYFSPVQEGTGDPSPDNVRPISGWDWVTVTRCGKNLVGARQWKSLLQAESLQEQEDEDGKYLDFYGWRAGFKAFSKNDVKQNTPYTFIIKTKAAESAAFIVVLYSDETLSTFTVGSGLQVVKFTTNANKTIQMIKIQQRNIHVKLYLYESGMFEGNIPVTDYEPYTGTSLTLPFPKTIYGGYVDLVKGEVVETWKKTSVGNGWPSYDDSVFHKAISGRKTTVTNANSSLISDSYKTFMTVPITQLSRIPDLNISARATYNVVFIKDARFSNGTDFSASMADSEFAYKLATPITHQLADGLNHITLGQDISPRPNGRSSTGGYANSSVIGSDGCTFVYFELGWTTEEFLQYSADISRRSEFVSDSRVLTSSTATNAKLGDMVLSTASTTDYDGDALVYLYVSVPSDCTDLESKRAYLAEHPIKITYPKKTSIPYTVDLTDLKPIKGTNNIWSNANNNIEVKFWKH